MRHDDAASHQKFFCARFIALIVRVFFAGRDHISFTDFVISRPLS
jgi:hypothetical protein